MNFTTRTKTVILSFLAIIIGLTSCEKDDINTENSSDTAFIYTGRYSTPDGRKFFMGAFPTIPTSNPDISKLTELAGTSVATFVFGESVFTWDGDASEMTKWKVEEDLSLTQIDVVSFINTGISGNNFGAQFFSDTEAYLPDLGNQIVVKWNPENMTITKTISVDAPNTRFDYWTWRTYKSGQNIVIPLEPGDWDNLETEAKVMVGIFNTQTETVTYAEDDRVQANSYLFPDENGVLYSYPMSTTALFEQYGTGGPYPKSGGMVRINVGDTQFDPNFYVNVMDATGGANSMGMFYLGNDNWLVKQYADTSDYPADEDLWDFWNKELEFKLYNHTTETATDFPGKSKGYSGNNGWFYVEGKHYHQSPDVTTGNTEIVIISENGWEPAFIIEGGDLNQLARIR